jgi:hypothetical protein
MLDTRPHVVEDAISDLAIGRTDVGGVSPFGCMAHLVVAAEFATPESAAFIVGRAHRLNVVDLRDRIAFRRTVTTAPVESPQARGRAGVAR